MLSPFFHSIAPPSIPSHPVMHSTRPQGLNTPPHGDIPAPPDPNFRFEHASLSNLFIAGSPHVLRVWWEYLPCSHLIVFVSSRGHPLALDPIWSDILTHMCFTRGCPTWSSNNVIAALLSQKIGVGACGVNFSSPNSSEKDYFPCSFMECHILCVAGWISVPS